MRTALTFALTCFILVACNNSTPEKKTAEANIEKNTEANTEKKTEFVKNFAAINPGMDTVSVIKLVGEPSDKKNVSLGANTLGIWVYDKDTAMISFKNGEVAKVAKGAAFKQLVEGLKEEIEKIKEIDAIIRK